MSFWRKNKGFIIFSLLLVLLIGFTSYNARQRVSQSWPEKLVLRLMSPLEQGSSYVVQRVNGFFRGFGELLSLRARNAELQTEVDSLRMQFNLLTETQRENQRLKQLLSYKQQNPTLSLQLAKVIAISDNPWQQELVIDQGSNNGLQNDMPIITNQGFVGRIYEAGPTTSKVVLISDARGPVAGRVQETRVMGTVEADPAKPGWLRMIRLPREASILPGYQVVTAGTGSLALPAGLIIGQVVSTEPTPDGLQLIAHVKPAVNFNILENILIVIGQVGP